MELLSQLWCGDVQPAHSFEESSAELRHLRELAQKNRKLLEESLTEAQKERLARCIECAEEQRFLSSEEAFCRGVRFGIRLAAEALI